MFCPECGKKIEEGALFCPECGTKITKQAQPQPADSAHHKKQARLLQAQTPSKLRNPRRHPQAPQLMPAPPSSQQLNPLRQPRRKTKQHNQNMKAKPQAQRPAKSSMTR